jgi:hypothetical protein
VRILTVNTRCDSLNEDLKMKTTYFIFRLKWAAAYFRLNNHYDLSEYANATL